MSRSFHAMRLAGLSIACGLSLAAGAAGAQDLPAAIAAASKTVLLETHAEGAQIYECTAAPAGTAAAWHLREPIATLIADGKTVGRHFAGPNWELASGARVTGKVLASAPGTTPKDIPWLKLDVTSHQGSGLLDGATLVQRIDTKGGVFDGACSPLGALHAEPYSATYLFLK